jgi:predicted transcriptional regulator
MTGKDLKELLDKYGLSQTDLANHFDITRQYVSYWISKDRPISRSWTIVFKQFFEEVNAKVLDNKLSRV